MKPIYITFIALILSPMVLADSPIESRLYSPIEGSLSNFDFGAFKRADYLPLINIEEDVILHSTFSMGYSYRDPDGNLIKERLTETSLSDRKFEGEKPVFVSVVNRSHNAKASVKNIQTNGDLFIYAESSEHALVRLENVQAENIYIRVNSRNYYSEVNYFGKIQVNGRIYVLGNGKTRILAAIDAEIYAESVNPIDGEMQANKINRYEYFLRDFLYN